MSSANKCLISYVAEVTQGTTPVSNLQYVPFTDSSMNLNISTTESAQVSSVRSTLDLVRTEGSTEASLGFEGQFGTYRAFMESALGASMKAGQALTATDISADTTDDSFNSVAAAFNTTQITPGSVIKVAGFTNAGNNGTFVVVSATSAKVVVNANLTAEAAGNSVTVKARDLRDAADTKSLSMEWYYSDLTTTYQFLKGAVVNTMNLNAATGSIVTGSFNLVGLTGNTATASIGTGYTAQNSAESWSPVGSIGSIYENGTALSGVCVSSISLDTNNNYRTTRCLGSLYPSSTPIGSFQATGSVSLYFNNTALLDKFIAGTATSLRFQFTDSDGQVFAVYMPNVKFNTGSVSGISKDSDVMLEIGYTALYDSTLGFALQISELA